MTGYLIDDDIADGFWREGISRELAKREGRLEGQTAIVDVSGDEIVSIGRPEILARLNDKLNEFEIKHRMVEVGRWPVEPEERQKAKEIFLPRLSVALKRLGERLGGPASIPASIVGDILESVEEVMLLEGPTHHGT